MPNPSILNVCRQLFGADLTAEDEACSVCAGKGFIDTPDERERRKREFANGRATKWKYPVCPACEGFGVKRDVGRIT